jgi:hypothetical protein
MLTRLTIRVFFSDIKHQQKFILNKNNNTQWVSTGYNPKKVFYQKYPPERGILLFKMPSPMLSRNSSG